MNVELGQQVYYVVPSWRGLVVTATVTALDDIYTHENQTVWHFRYLNGEDSCYISTDELNENGWKIHKKFPIEELKNLERVNQLPWIDEPVGHAVDFGGDTFATLEEARKVIRPCSSRKKHRRLRQWRNRNLNFIASTHHQHGYRAFRPNYPDKKIYTR